MAEAALYMLHKGVYLSAHVHNPQSLKYFEEFTFRKDDVIIATYPKSGIVGDWKNQLTVAEAEYFDAVYTDKIKDFKYTFPWVLDKVDEQSH